MNRNTAPKSYLANSAGCFAKRKQTRNFDILYRD